jgi:signal peptidase II
MTAEARLPWTRFWLPAGIVLLLDVVTKRIAEAALVPYVPRQVIGNAVRFTLAYNPGAAFSMSLGEHSRWLFTAITIGVLVILWRTYRRTAPGDRLQLAALSLIAGGALGNLADRLRSPHGVVDFIDVGWGTIRFWTFNVADSGVSIGAVLLALSLLRASRDVARPDEPQF